jgi:hypothetical protein
MNATSIHDPATGTVTLPASAWELRPALFKILAWLYATQPFGVPLEVSNGTICKAVALSESTVSNALHELAQLGYLSREWNGTTGTGRGGYVTTLHHLAGSDVDPNGEGSVNDPSRIDPSADGIAMREIQCSVMRDRQSIPPTNMEDHDSYQEEEEDSPARVSTDSLRAAQPWLDAHPDLVLSAIPGLMRSGISTPQFTRLLHYKQATGAGIGAAVQAVRDARLLGIRDWDAWLSAMEAQDGRAGADRGVAGGRVERGRRGDAGRRGTGAGAGGAPRGRFDGGLAPRGPTLDEIPAFLRPTAAT